jgi:hypothetical protein
MYADARKPGVMAQFCVLQTAVPGYLPASNVQRERGEPRSIVSMLTRYLGTSSSGQFIFESYLGKLEEFSAAVIFHLSPAQQVFLANKSLYAMQDWSQWVQPDLVSGDQDIRSKILYGKNPGKDNGGPRKVLARFKVGSYVDWRRETDDINARTDLDPCPLTPTPSL